MPSCLETGRTVMGFKITQRPAFLKKIERASGLMQKEFKKEMLLHETHIAKNTLGGKGYDDKRFREYSPATKKIRKAAGLQVSPPNLSQTGGMLKALKSKISKAANGYVTGIIFVSNQAQRPLKNKGKSVSAAVKARSVMNLGFTFFGITPKQVEEIQKKTTSAFMRGLFK